MPYISYQISLADNLTAEKFLMFLRERSVVYNYNVDLLYLGRSINVITAGRILERCVKLTLLVIAFCYCHIPLPSQNPLYSPLSKLRSLKCLYVPLVNLHTNRVVYLPDFDVFHCLTHLHLLASGMAWLTIPLGFAALRNLTHLLLHWTTVRESAPILPAYLDRPSAVLLILWKDATCSDASIQGSLRHQGLVNRRLVVLKNTFTFEDIDGGGFWTYAQRIVEWRVKYESKCAHLYNSSSSLLIL